MIFLPQLSENMFESVNEIKAELALENQSRAERQSSAKRGRCWEGRKARAPFMGPKKITTKIWASLLFTSLSLPPRRGQFQSLGWTQGTWTWLSGFSQSWPYDCVLTPGLCYGEAARARRRSQGRQFLPGQLDWTCLDTEGYGFLLITAFQRSIKALHPILPIFPVLCTFFYLQSG